MAGKQLPIKVRADDQASRIIQTVNRSVRGLGIESVRSTRSADGGFKKLIGTIRQYKALIIGAAGVLAARRIVHGLIETTREVDRLAKTAKRLEIPVERLSEMRYIADRNGQEFESLAKAVMTAQKNLAEFATTGVGEADDAVRALGLRLRDNRGELRDIMDLLPEIADGMKGLSPAQQTFVASKLFGRGGFELLTTLKLTGEEIRQLTDDARRYGAVITASQAAAAERIADSLGNIRTAWTHVKVSVIEEIAPLVSDTVNAVAERVAKIPRYIGDAAYAVREIVFGGEARAEILEQARGVLDAVGGLLVAGLEGAGRLALVTALAVVDTFFGSLSPVVSARTQDMLGDAVVDAQATLLRVLGKTPILSDLITGGREWELGEAADLIEQMHEFSRSIAEPASVVSGYNTALTDNSKWAREYAAAWQDLRETAGPAAAEVGDRLDRLLATVERLRGLTKDGVLGPTPDDSSAGGGGEWAKFLAGVEEGYDAVMGAAEDTAAVARQGVTSLMTSLSQGLAGAFLDAVSGAKNFGQAMREVLANTLRMVAELILQMLILRAVSGVVSAFGGGGGGGVSNFVGPVQPAAKGGLIVPGGVVPGYAAGGQVLAVKSMAIGAVPRYDMGGLVGGARMYRDSQLIAAMPGEHVANRTAVSVTGVETLRRGNRGERLVTAGSAGGLSLSLTVNVDARGAEPGATERAVRRGVMDAVVDGLARNPTARTRLRNMLR